MRRLRWEFLKFSIYLQVDFSQSEFVCYVSTIAQECPDYTGSSVPSK